MSEITDESSGPVACRRVSLLACFEAIASEDELCRRVVAIPESIADETGRDSTVEKVSNVCLGSVQVPHEMNGVDGSIDTRDRPELERY